MDGSAMSLDGRVAIVTGGAGGIGRATAQLFVERGARVVLADLDAVRAEEVAHEIGEQAIACHVDLARAETIEAMMDTAIARFGRIDVLDNNAAYTDPSAVALDGDIQSVSIDLWDKAFTVNARGTMLACRAAMPHLLERGGAIVNIVSNLALQGHLVQVAYSASKAALIQLTRSIAASHGRRGVRCNAVAPGLTMTPAIEAAFPPPLRAVIEGENLREGLGRPEDIAEVVAFLSSDAARNVNGHCLVADAGATSHVPNLAGFAAFMS